MSQTTISTVLGLISQALSVYDIEAAPLFKQAGINITAPSSKEHQVPMTQVAKLWQLAVDATQNNELGLVAASLFQPTYLKGIGLAWMASANLEQGLRRFVEQSQLINSAMQVKLIEQGDELLIQYHSKLAPAQRVKGHPCGIQLGIGFFLGMFRIAAAKKIPATGVYFSFAIAGDKKAYQDFFQCPIHDNQAINGISFSKSLLNEQLPSHDPELAQINEMAVNKHLAAMKNGETSTKVTKIITELLPTGCANEETVAFKLHLSKRTLQRKLHAEDQSFVQLLSSIRLLLAKQQLEMSSCSITEITYQLGYNSPSAFARAFKKHTNLSPLQYRASHRV